MKLTPWFSNDTKPARVGWYQCKWCRNGNAYVRHYWDGTWWRWSEDGSYLDGECDVPWRGIANKDEDHAKR